MDVPLDPEDARVSVIEHHGSATWLVALVLEQVPVEQGGLADARRLAEGWRERLGLVGPDWVRRADAAARIGVGVKMIDKLRRAGRLRGRRVEHTNRAYVHRDDVEALATERGVPGRAEA